VTTWVKPQLVAEVKFTEWTSSGEMRHPVYLGLRTDKRAEDVSSNGNSIAPDTRAKGCSAFGTMLLARC
jgi:bifunctional non-homologous end joining protein LigD